MLMPERGTMEWWATPGQRSVANFTDGSKIGAGTDAGAFCRVLGHKLQFRFNDDSSVFQAEILIFLRP